MLSAYNVRPEDLKRNLETLEEAVREIVPEPNAATQILAEALARFDALPLEQESFIATAGGLSGLAKAYLDALLGGHRQLAGKLVLEAVRSGTNVRNIYLDVFQATQREVGRLWQSNRINVAQEHYCTAATQLVMAQLYPWVFAAERNGRSMVATCVSGDLHELGVLRYAPDLVVSDAMMPGLDGRELSRQLKSKPETSGVKVIVMTSLYKGERYKAEAIRAFGVDDYLAKPVDPATLLAAAERQLDGIATASTRASLRRASA